MPPLRTTRRLPAQPLLVGRARVAERLRRGALVLALALGALLVTARAWEARYVPTREAWEGWAKPSALLGDVDSAALSVLPEPVD